MIKYSIVVPCYNEARNIPLILEKFSTVVNEATVEVILVNNGSTDDSVDVLDRLIPQYSFAKLESVQVNQGYGFGILAGLKRAKGEYLGWTHADMQTDPIDVIKAFGLTEQSSNNINLFIKGSRRGRSLFDNLFTIGMSLFESAYLRTWLWEINAQPNIFHRSFYQSWHNPPRDFSLDLYVYYCAKQQGLEVQRFSVEFPPRLHGTSSWNNSLQDKYKFIVRTLKFSRELKSSLTEK